MMSIKVIGIDLGKSVFHLVAHDYRGQIEFRKKLSRQKLKEFLSNHPLTTIAFEACGGAHWLGRYCQAIGHRVKLLPPQYVRPYVKGNKNDFIDADAIAEASERPSMRFVAVKSEQAQVISAIHRIRSGYIKERTAGMSRVGALLLEFGMSLPRGHASMKRLFSWLATQRQSLPPMLMD
ncbi:MAG: IS110 family transposase, partial [Leucothrix sp.]